MKAHAKVKVNKNKLKWPEKYYIHKAEEYDIKCEIEHMHIGIIYNEYNLILNGTKENIESFFGYLKMMGFKIEQF